MSNGFNSKVEMGKEFDNLKSDIKEIASEALRATKEVYEAAESKGLYNNIDLNDKLEDQIQDMRKEEERLQSTRDKEEFKEEKAHEDKKTKEDNKQEKTYSYDMER